jgi:hypothetical protein
VTRMTRLFLPFLVLVAFSGVACNSQEGVEPDQFATDVCSAAKQWVDDIQQGAQDFGGGLSAQSSPEEIRDGLVGFLEDAIAQTETLIGQVQNAGVPAVDNGEQASGSLVSAFQRVKTAFEDARDRASELPTDDQQAFATGAQELGSTVQQSLVTIGSELQNQQNKDLEGAFDENAACTELQSAGTP